MKGLEKFLELVDAAIYERYRTSWVVSVIIMLLAATSWWFFREQMGENFELIVLEVAGVSGLVGLVFTIVEVSRLYYKYRLQEDYALRSPSVAMVLAVIGAIYNTAVGSAWWLSLLPLIVIFAFVEWLVTTSQDYTQDDKRAFQFIMLGAVVVFSIVGASTMSPWLLAILPVPIVAFFGLVIRDNNAGHRQEVERLEKEIRRWQAEADRQAERLHDFEYDLNDLRRSRDFEHRRAEKLSVENQQLGRLVSLASEELIDRVNWFFQNSEERMTDAWAGQLRSHFASLAVVLAVRTNCLDDLMRWVSPHALRSVVVRAARSTKHEVVVELVRGYRRESVELTEAQLGRLVAFVMA